MVEKFFGRFGSQQESEVKSFLPPKRGAAIIHGKKEQNSFVFCLLIRTFATQKDYYQQNQKLQEDETKHIILDADRHVSDPTAKNWYMFPASGKVVKK